MNTFVDAMNRAAGGEKDAWEEAFQCFDFDAQGRERANDTATELLGILNRLEEIPSASSWITRCA